MSRESNMKNIVWARRVRLAIVVSCLALAGPVIAQTPLPDLCGCRNHPASLGAFDTRDRNTWPPGTTVTGITVTLPLPPDGVLVFDSMHIEWATPAIPSCCVVEVGFQRNAANTPVTLLVKGNVTIANNGVLHVRGANGLTGTTEVAGGAGLGGPGGFRGGDGAYLLGNLATAGGAGLGPGGGPGATATPQAPAGGATFVGATDLLPLVGGAGGGGGRSTNPTTACSAGGGGGGGGALLLAANGSITIGNFGGGIVADGGNGGSPNGFPCASSGAGGAGGGIRVLANTIAGPGRIMARGGRRAEDSAQAGSGAIRLEALTNTFGVASADPVASRTAVPGPIVNPFTPTITLTSVAGQPVPPTPQGFAGGVDVQVPVPGPTAIDLATEGVPSGTSVEVKVKPRVGGLPITQNVTLTNCDATESCLASLTLDLAAGVYTIEARATFQSPGQ